MILFWAVRFEFNSSIIRLRSKTRLKFTRNWTHIREDGTDVTVLWFVKNGKMSISHQAGISRVDEGGFAITKSTSPFTIECSPGEDAVHEVLHIVVPTHLFRRFMPNEIRIGFATNNRGRQFDIAEHILVDVFDDGDELTENVEQTLIESALTVLADAIKARDDYSVIRQSLPDQRLQDVLRYIDLHLSDPSLSTSMVADACGISPRYLSFLLKQNGTPFSELVWDKRMKIASRWLATSKPTEISIAEIAFRVGFKSPAHFSRMFKRVFNKGPREYRADCQIVDTENGRNYLSTTNFNTLQ